VFIPLGGLSYFFQRLDQYAAENTRSGKPRHANMIERIAALRIANLPAPERL